MKALMILAGALLSFTVNAQGFTTGLLVGSSNRNSTHPPTILLKAEPPYQVFTCRVDTDNLHEDFCLATGLAWSCGASKKERCTALQLVEARTPGRKPEVKESGYFFQNNLKYVYIIFK